MSHLNKIRSISLASLVLIATNIMAMEANASTLLYISPNDYKYSVHLLHPYYDYWFEQGSLVEPIALSALKAQNSDLSLCQANETADRVIRVTPSLFYNPQLRVYHSRLAATVYSGSGNVLGTYVGEGKQQGFTSVDHAITMHLNKAYSAAMQDLMAKIDAGKMAEDKATTNLASQTKLPCGLIGAQAEPKINFY